MSTKNLVPTEVRNPDRPYRKPVISYESNTKSKIPFIKFSQARPMADLLHIQPMF